uniref:Eukaryotic translation initiation factor 4E-1d2 n=1 Tax=Amphidinium carterae TaxID=2961 RepID=A0A2Z2FGI0_AMPCA|nr:eukaryotic translation initiation factor 4E-1d2 [Amphidinium carterae]|mmetsp:Transcript_45638/g.105947  ORF Transcript_45638/g.105947 Transcript_45638/m.105947 type:complete len:288 (+) Transcript_45638:49-912(+)
MAGESSRTSMAAASSGSDKKDAVYLSLNMEVQSPQEIDAAIPEATEDDAECIDMPLKFKWSVWEQRVQDKKSEYSAATKEAASFDSVSSFWSCWSHIPQPSQLLSGRSFARQDNGATTRVDALMIFRDGIRPQWEDPANIEGGHVEIKLYPKLGGGAIDELWNNTVMGVIGGTIQPTDMVAGVRLVDKLNHKTRPMLRIELWFNDIANQGKVDMLKETFKECLRAGIDGEERPEVWPTEVIPHKTEKKPAATGYMLQSPSGGQTTPTGRRLAPQGGKSGGGRNRERR